jgi:peptidyl-prolyl cis-trans isomerase D
VCIVNKTRKNHGAKRQQGGNMAAGMKKLSNTFVWILMGLLIAGLAGFGAVNMSGTVRTVATVGNQTVSVDEYYRELQREIRAIEAQTGQLLPMSQAVSLGLDQSVLARLVSLASLDSEVADLGLSIGDKNLQREILEIPAFQGINGEFDQESYKFSLQQVGLNDAEFEADLRAQAARTLVQGAIVAGVVMPTTMVDTVANYVAARRSFTMARLDGTTLTQPVTDPTDTELQAFYDAHPDDFTLPETKRISYVLMTPTMLLDQVDVDEAAMQQLFDDRRAQYNVPERRLVERLVFADSASASDAMAQLEVNGTTFEALVDAHGLSLGDIDLGDLSRDDLDDAAEAVFSAEIGKVVGPLESSLGPALYRINGSLAAQVTSFDDAKAELRDELASERARRLVDAQAENIDDLLAGGATLAELDDETDMELGQLDWTFQSFEGVAAYSAFRAAAAAVNDSDFPEVTFLDDGGMFALRLDEVLPERPEPFDDAKDRVRVSWTLAETQTALQAQANEVVAELAVNGDFTATGLDHKAEIGLTRTAYLDGTPADFMTQVFEMTPQELRVIVGEGVVYVVQLDETLPPEETPELEGLRSALGDRLNQSLSQALFDAFVNDAQQRARPTLDQRALNAVQASFQ